MADIFDTIEETSLAPRRDIFDDLTDESAPPADIRSPSSPTSVPSQLDEWLRPSGAPRPMPPRAELPGPQLATNISTTPTHQAEEPIPEEGGGSLPMPTQEEWARIRKKIALQEEVIGIGLEREGMERMEKALYTPPVAPSALAMPEAEKGPLAAEFKAKFPDQSRAPSVIQTATDAERESETIQRSIAEGLSGMTTGEQVILLGAAGASGRLGGVAGRIAEKAVPATFGVEGIKGTVQGVKHLLGATTPEERGQAQAEIALSAPMIVGVGTLFKPNAPVPPRIKAVIQENARILPKAAEAAAKVVSKDVGQKLEKPVAPEPVKPSDTKVSTPPANDTLPPESEVPATEVTDAKAETPPTAVTPAPAESLATGRGAPAGRTVTESAPVVSPVDNPQTPPVVSAQATPVTLVQRIEQLPDADAAKLSQKTESYRNLKFSTGDVPALERASRDAFARAEAAVESGDYVKAQADMGRGIFFNGAVEWANKKGPNYEASMKELAAAKPAPTVPESTPPSAVRSPSSDRAAFTARLKEYGEQLGFIQKPDDVHGWTGGSSKSGQSGASVKAKVRHDREMAASRRRAITDLGGDPDKPDFAALNTELEKRIAEHEAMGYGAHTELTGKESTEFLPGDAGETPELDMLSEKHDLTRQQSEMVLEAFKSLTPDANAEALQKAYLKLAIPADMPTEVGLGKVGGLKGAKEVLTDLREASAGEKALAVRQAETAGRNERNSPPSGKTEEGAPETATPKLAAGEKGTGDLFKGTDQPFNLAGEKGVDTERVATERAAAEQRTAEAKAAQEKQQQTLPGTEQKGESGPTSDLRAPSSGKGLAGSVRKKWTSATDSPLGGEGGFITLGPIEDFLESVTKGVKGVGSGVKNAFDAARAAAKENMELSKASDYRRAVLHWSAKMQRSFSEAAQAHNDLREAIKDPARRDGATNWIQADGDPAVLQQRLAATQAWRDPVTGKPHPDAKRLIAGYEAALHLTPEEIAAATDAKNAYDALGARGQSYDVLKSFKDNYVTQVWDIKKGPHGGNKGFGFGARQLKERFRFAKASTFATYFDGEQAGFVPKTKDISGLLPMYLHEMNNVIAARQLVEQLAKGTASDGRPLLAPRGAGVAVDNAAGKATLIMPDAMKADTADYVRMENQPALHDWRWQTKDAAGNPVFMKSDLVIHPEAADRFKNVLGKSAISEWYNSKTSASAEIPKAIAKALDRAQSETKRTMLGLLSPFHQVQEGTHAIGHRVNPFFNNPKIDLVNNPAQYDAAQHGLMLQPDRVSAEQFMEGFKHSGLISKVPGVGALADHYAHYLFHEYIPGIKFKTYEAIRERNLKVFERDITSGRVTPEDVKILSAEQANAAYGHLNYADLGRNPTMQHFLRLALLAPDFLEARGRFAGQAVKGATGGKVGREQLVALATLAVAQATLAYTMAKIAGGEWDKKDPFAFHLGNRKFTMRSVPEDAYRLVQDTRAFTYARLNPLIGRGTVQYLSGVDWRGKKVTAGETTRELLKQPVPLTLRPLFGIGNTPLSGWEELAGAAGLKIQRYSNVAEVSKLAHAWMDKSDNPRIKAAEKQHQQETLPDSAYKPLREALLKDDENAAREALEELLKIRKYSEITKAMHAMRPFTGSLKVENQFRRSLTAEAKLQYEAARREQRDLYNKFRRLRAPNHQ